MKAKAKKTAPRGRKKPVRKTSSKAEANGLSSPYGYRAVEGEWLEKHPEKLRPHIGEYVVVEGRRIVAHSKDAGEAIKEAKRKGVKIPFIFFVPPPLPKNTYWIGP
jgi:uncharacterized protein DUF5678